MLKFVEELLQGETVEWKRLGEISKFYGGLTGKNKHDFENGRAAYIPYKNIFDNLEINPEQIGRVNITAEEHQNEIMRGDVLFTASSETPEEVGMSSAVTKSFLEPVYLNSFSFGMRFTSEVKLLPEFSKYLFRSSFVRGQIIKTASGVTRFNISKKLFKNILIPIPPLRVQEKIVEVLDKFIELESTLKAELALRKTQYEYYRNKLLTFGKEVEWIELGEIGDIRMCKRILKNQTSASGDVPFYKIGTFGKKADAYISRALFNEYKAKYNYPKFGDVLISTSGTIGRVVLFDGNDAYFQDSNIVWIENDEARVLNKYLFYCYQIAEWEVTNGGTITRLYNENLRATRIPIPYGNDTEQSLSEQARIVAILDKFDTLVNSLCEGLPREIELRYKQYEYYRDQLLTFPAPETRY